MSIRIQEENPDLLSIYYKTTMDQQTAFNFLQSKGYRVKEWLWKFQDTTFPNGTTNHEVWTFTATKNDEKQSEETLYKRILENELKKLFSI